MLKPTKHAHPDKTVIAVATVILRRVRSRRVEGYDELHHHLASVVEGTSALFLPALNLLFLLGLIEYRPKTDAFEYTGH